MPGHNDIDNVDNDDIGGGLFLGMTNTILSINI